MFPGLPTASLPIAKLFDSPYIFKVPVYQRAFAWTVTESGQVFDDLTVAAGLDEPDAASPDYFFGAILLLDPESEGANPPPPFSGSRVYEVVDGQQRLLTFAILASVLRDAEDADADAGSEGAQIANRLHAMIVPAPDPRDLTGRVSRILLSDAEQRYLESRILPRGQAKPAETEAADEVTGIPAVRAHFAKMVKPLGAADRRKLAVYLMESCHVVVIVSRDIDRAHRLFTVLNERGRPLGRHDILKVEVLRNMPPEAMAAALASWDASKASLDKEFEPFMGHLRDIYGLRQGQIIASMRALIRRVGPEKFVNGVLVPYAAALKTVRTFQTSPQAEAHKKLTQALVSLNRLGGGDWMPAAMVVMQGFPDDPGGAAVLMEEIERFAYVMRILCFSASRRDTRFAHVLRAMRDEPATVLQSPVWDFTRDELRTAAFHLKDLHERAAQVSKLVLMRIEDDLAGTPLTIEPARFTIEHVLPRRPSGTSEWRRLYPIPEERHECQLSLGNLALLTERQNDRAKNKDFAEKLTAYREADPTAPVLVSNAAIWNAKSWLATDIRAREAQFIAVLNRIWRMDINGETSAPGSAPKPVRMFG